MTLAEASVLIVDDEPILRMTFRLLLQRSGATAHVAADGAEALEVLQREPVDLLLTDKQMPVMDGIMLLETLAERSATVPAVLFVNGAARNHSSEDLKQLGVVETISKPMHPEALLQALERVLAPLPARRKTV